MKIVVALLFSALFAVEVSSQLPVEVFAGDKKTTFDLLFFRYFKNSKGKSSPWLFFNRNRASIDYKMTTTTNLPQFGFTEAISFNKEKLKGFAPVAVVQVLNRGVYPKAGIQYAHTGKEFTFFSWVVVDLLKRPNLDWFVLTRYQPKITERLHLFTQVELINSLPTNRANNYNFIQRVRVGLKWSNFQTGFGGDFSTLGRTSFAGTQNSGVFVRYEF